MSSIQEIDIREIEEKISSLRAEQQLLHKKKEPIDNRLLDLYREIATLNDQRDKARIENGVKWVDIIKDLGGGGGGSLTLLRHADKMLEDWFDMHGHGYYPDTSEASFSVKIDTTNPESLAKNRSGVAFFATIMTPHADGHVWFGIFEHTLSEGGSYMLKVNLQNQDFVINKTVYGHTRIVRQFTDLDETMKYIAKELSYNHPEGKG